MSNNSTNTSTKDVSSQYQYIAFGTIAITFNCLILFTLFRNKQLLLKSAFVFGFALGDLLDGVALLGNGVSRLYQVLNHLDTIMVHPSYCSQVYGFSAVFIMGNQIPGIMFLLVGIERLLAVQYFQWYYLNWSNKIAWVCTSFGYGYCAFSLAAAFVIVNTMPASIRIPISCGTLQAMGVPYIAYNYIICIIGGVFAIAGTIWAMVSFTRRRRKLNNAHVFNSDIKLHIARQWNKTRIMLLMTLLDMGLVVLPYVLLLLKNAVGWDAVQNLGGIALQMGCARSIPNLLIYFAVNVEFRKGIFKAFGAKSGSIGVKQTIVVKVFNNPNLQANMF